MNCWLRRLMSSLRVVRRSNSPVIGHNLQNGPAAYTTGGRRSYTAESHCAARPHRAYTLLHRAYSLAAKLRLSEYGKDNGKGNDVYETEEKGATATLNQPADDNLLDVHGQDAQTQMR